MKKRKEMYNKDLKSVKTRSHIFQSEKEELSSKFSKNQSIEKIEVTDQQTNCTNEQELLQKFADIKQI